MSLNKNQNGNRYFEGLDVLRAFAVFFVIITHWGPNQFSSTTFTAIYQKIVPDGNFGVDLFFVLSGYLITRILLNARLTSGDTDKYRIIKAFYLRRSLRIFPIYYLLVFVMFFAGDQGVQNHLAYYLTYTSNFLVFKTQNWDSITHTWSLAVEEQFYLLWPWVIVFCPQKKLFIIITSFLSLGILSSLYVHYFYGDIFFVLLPPALIAFTIGGLWAHQELFSSKKMLSILKIAFTFALVFFAISQFGYQLILIRLVNAIIAINLIRYVTAEKYNKLTGIILKNSVLIYIGKISYGIYLYHFITPRYYLLFIDYLNGYLNFSTSTLQILKYPPPAYLIQLAIVFLISHLSFKYLEKTFIRLKQYANYTSNLEMNVAQLASLNNYQLINEKKH